MKAGWRTEKLGEVCSFLNRGISPRYLDQGGICVLNQKCIRDHRVSYEQSRRHDAEAKVVTSERIIQVGDVLVNSTGTGTLGRVAQVRDTPAELTTVDSHVTIVRPKPGKFYPDFFGYMLVLIEEAIKEAGEGCGGQTELARSVLAERFSVSYPTSLPEQRQIVGILDEAFEHIATAKANCEKNLQNARALFESHLNAVFTQRGEDWKTVSLQALLDHGWIVSHLDGNHGGDYPRKEEFTSEGVPYISAKCIEDEQVDMSRAKYLSLARASALRKGVAFDGDVLFAHNATVGPVAILHTDEEKVILGTSLTYYRCNLDRILPEYLAHYMRSSGFKNQYQQVMKQSTRNQVPITKQREFFHVIPPVEEQKKIVRGLDGLFESGRRLESLYQRKLAALDELKKSLLHQAFSGQLTAKFSSSAVIPFPVKLPNINTTDLHAGILAMAYQRHEQNGNPKHFGHVKAEKIAHLAEVYVGIDLGRQPVKDVAGPNDYLHLKNKVEPRAKKAGYFDFQRTTEAGGYQVTKLRQFDALLEKTRAALGDHVQAVDRLLDLLLPMNTQQAEVMCTVYAGWNNLLLEGRQPSDEEIVYESRENWHTAKLNIPREKFFAAIRWMREKDLVPTGRGKSVLAKQGKQ